MSNSRRTPSSGDRLERASEKVRLKAVERRKELNLTQRIVSDKVGVMESTIANWESGRRSLDWMVRAKRYCEALDISIDEFVEDDEGDDAETLEELLALIKDKNGPTPKELLELYKSGQNSGVVATKAKHRSDTDNKDSGRTSTQKTTSLDRELLQEQGHNKNK